MGNQQPLGERERMRVEVGEKPERCSVLKGKSRKHIKQVGVIDYQMPVRDQQVNKDYELTTEICNMEVISDTERSNSGKMAKVMCDKSGLKGK